MEPKSCPADEDDCLTIPDRNVLPHGPSGERLFPMFDNEPPTYTATLALPRTHQGEHGDANCGSALCLRVV